MVCLKLGRITFTIFLLLTSFCQVFAQVNLSSGAAEASFPLFQYSDADRLSFAVSLNYTAGNGVLVGDAASNVGLGWDLSAGGVIVRQQLGEPDDQSNQNNPGSYSVSNGYLYTAYGPTTPTSPQLGYGMLTDGFAEMSLEEAASSDKLQDIFTFSFNGMIGSFVIGKNGECKTLNDSRLRITKVLADMTASNIVTRISEFTITDDSGIQYVFREKGISRIVRYSGAGNIKVNVAPEVSLGGAHALVITGKIVTDVYAVGSWHLSEIINPLSNKKITLSYVTNDLDYVSALEPVLSQTNIDGNKENVIQENKILLKSTAKVLKSVTFPGEVNIDITYNTTPRADVPGAAYSLKKLAVKKGATELYAYEFTYKYFSKANLRDETYVFPADEKEYARLCLASFKKMGRDGLSEPAVEFTYAKGPSGTEFSEDWIPKRLSTRRDFWGYYNGNGATERPYTGTETAIASARFDNYADMLHFRRRLPFNDPERTPGESRFAVAQNGALKTIKTPNGGILEYTYESNYALYNGQPQMTGGVRVKSVSVTDGLPGSIPVVTTYKYILQNGQSSGWGYEDLIFNQTRHTIMRVPNNVSATTKVASAYQNRAAIEDNIRKIIPTQPLEGKPKGLKAEKVRVFSADNYIDATLNIAGILYTLYRLFFSGSTTKYFDVQITHPRGFVMGNSLPCIYSRVEVISGTDEDNLGKTVYEYTSPVDCPLLIPTLTAPYSPRPRYLPWAYGLLKRMMVYSKNNQLIRETYNDYVFLKRDGDANFANSQVSPSTTLISDVSFYNNNMHLPQFDRDDYTQIFGRTELKRTVERTYALDGNFKNETVEYEYDQTNYLVKKVISYNERNERIERRVYYPSDYTIQDGSLPLMRSSFIANEPVSTETWLIKSPQDHRLINAEISDYQRIPNGDIKATKRYSLNTTAAIPAATIGEFDPAALVRNATYFKEDVSISYNAAGNIAGVVHKGRISGLLYNDAGTTVIASVRNAGVSRCAFSSFEDGAFGSWSISGTPDYISDASAPTGSRCLSMSGVTDVRKADLHASVKYALTYWSKGGQLNVNGNVLRNETGRTENGWTIHYLTVTGVSEVILTGTGYVDELRLHPVNSTMQTMSYDVAGNLVTEAGADNSIVKKEYDGLNRLVAIKDQQGNILEAVKYQYKGQ